MPPWYLALRFVAVAGGEVRRVSAAHGATADPPCRLAAGYAGEPGAQRPRLAGAGLQCGGIGVLHHVVDRVVALQRGARDRAHEGSVIGEGVGVGGALGTHPSAPRLHEHPDPVQVDSGRFTADAWLLDTGCPRKR